MTSAARRFGSRNTSGSGARSTPRSSVAEAASAMSSSRCSSSRSSTAAVTRACDRRTRSMRCTRWPRRATWHGAMPRRSPTPTASCAGWSTVCRSCATCRRTTCRPTAMPGPRWLGRSASRMLPPSNVSTTVRPVSSGDCTSACSTVRSSRRSRDPLCLRRASTARRPRSCSKGWGSRTPRVRTRCSRGWSIPARGSARCSRMRSP